jgi:hypothetical protein
MSWISKYRIKTFEELEPYKVQYSGVYYYRCGYNNIIYEMFKYCGLPLNNLNYTVDCSEYEFINRERQIAVDNWSITYDMVINIVEIRKKKLDKLNDK